MLMALAVNTIKIYDFSCTIWMLHTCDLVYFFFVLKF